MEATVCAVTKDEWDWFVPVSRHGQPTGYRGAGEFLRDYQAASLQQGAKAAKENKKRWDKTMTRAREGKAAGPFRRPPFPNAQCPEQAVVVKDFSIPKDTWNVGERGNQNLHKLVVSGRAVGQ